MADKGANIDLVFRNGLKDYEVLPPPEVWENIHPVIKSQKGSILYIRVAASIAVILTIGFSAYRLTREVPVISNSEVIAYNEPISVSQSEPGSEKSVAVKSSRINSLIIPGEGLTPVSMELISTSDTLFKTSTVLTPASLNSNFSEISKPSLKGPRQTFLKDVPSGFLKTEDIYLQYLSEDITTKTPDRWSIAAMASPTYYSAFNSGSDDISKQINASEQPVASYTGGVSFSYKVNKRFSIQSGLYYSSLGQVVDGINSYSGFQRFFNTKGSDNFRVITSNGTVSTNNADVFLSSTGPYDRILTNYTKDIFDPVKASLPYINNSLRQNFSFLELPVILRYKVVDRVVDLNVIGGVSYNLLVANSVYTIVDGSKYPIGETDGLNVLNFSSSLGMGMEYSLSDKLSLNLEPTFRYYMNPFNGETGSKFHPYSFGIFSGLSYKF